MWLALLSCVALGAEGRVEEVVDVPVGEVVDGDLYAAGERLIVAGTVRGDLYAVGRQIEVTGQVTGDAVLVARDVDVSGVVGDDLRVVAETVDVTGTVRDHLLGVARMLLLPSGSHVDGDVVVAAYGVLLGGNVGEDVVARVASLDLQGTVLGDADLVLGIPEDTEGTGLSAGPRARIGGDLRYGAPAPVSLPEELVSGQVTYAAVPYLDAPQRPPVLARVSRLAVLALVGLVLAAVAPRRLDMLAAGIRARPARTLGWGVIGVALALAAAVAVAVAALVLAVVLGLLTFVGLAALTAVGGVLAEGLLIAGFAWVVGYVAPVIVAYLAGRWLLDRGPGTRRPGAGWAVLLGVTLYVVVASIPILGQAVAVVAALVGLGALVQPQAWKASTR